ncbi:helix-turn-helix domain-containing protein [Agrobacterium rosae]|uniref:helix-turn-helix domain-containing protein n=1 Tax=Agrobacterium rosae TaxID=1972867 RepID=UPI002A144574|nr:helix-turn-helix transcriptional regulator [Agrobacterium rosae]MDX8314428.1 helix-turn-helix transcriptional regulator [Agrobacterium rosae]
MTKSTHTPEYRHLVELLIATRREAKLTQQQLANRLGKPQSYVAKVEGAERRIDVVEFATLARAMDKSPTALLDRLLADIEKLERVQDFP